MSVYNSVGQSAFWYMVLCTGIIVCVLASGLSGSGLNPGWGHCVVFFNLGQVLYSHSTSLRRSVEMDTSKLSAVI